MTYQFGNPKIGGLDIEWGDNAQYSALGSTGTGDILDTTSQNLFLQCSATNELQWASVIPNDVTLGGTTTTLSSDLTGDTGLENINNVNNIACTSINVNDITCTSINNRVLPTTNFTPWLQSQRTTFTASIGQNLTNWDIPNACIPLMCSAHINNGSEFVPGGTQSTWIGYANSGGTGLRRIKHYADFGSTLSVVAYIAYFTPATAIS